jgi:ABC-type transport system involved in cytochrome bd biosynthesis fused ATPase/permease subunit
MKLLVAGLGQFTAAGCGHTFGEQKIQSGGEALSLSEKRKILLGRMLYQGGDVYLIDNFFDELEMSFREDLYEAVIGDYLRDKTVIFCCSDYRVLKKTDKIAVFRGGKIWRTGTFWDLLDQKGDQYFLELLKEGLGSTSNKLTKIGMI